ncbi:MAG: TetR family transcriptional regulator C-terminal domain-containing protein, partial [Bacteroidota bacterium]|nr:TetR family transcriptional regulator C-terminal domain-containing protein [Bacteroidota bacterium]
LREYELYVLENGSQPATVYRFTKKLGMEEVDFYDRYNSFNALEKQIWKGYFDETVKRVESEEIYNQYSVREKLLAFYYTLVEVLKSNRSFVSYTLKDLKRSDRNPEVLRSFKEQFMYFINELLNEGKETDEVINRPFISNRYDEGIWLQFLFVLSFWLHDDSNQFEKTDAAIEKAVHLSFDLMGKGPLDTMVDFAKFIYQNR